MMKWKILFVQHSGLLLEGVSETIKMKQPNKNEDFLVCYWVH